MHRKKRTRESPASTKKSSNKKARKTGGKVSKKLIEELLTDISDNDRSLKETSESASNFLQLSERIDLKTKKHLEASFSVILIRGNLYINDTRS